MANLFQICIINNANLKFYYPWEIIIFRPYYKAYYNIIQIILNTAFNITQR